MQLIEGFMAVLHPATLFLIIGGVVAGIVFGAIPGLSAFTALALFLPITFGMEPVNGIAFLIAIYLGGLSGGTDLSNPAWDSRNTLIHCHLL